MIFRHNSTVGCCMPPVDRYGGAEASSQHSVLVRPRGHRPRSNTFPQVLIEAHAKSFNRDSSYLMDCVKPSTTNATCHMHLVHLQDRVDTRIMLLKTCSAPVYSLHPHSWLRGRCIQGTFSAAYKAEDVAMYVLLGANQLQRGNEIHE